MKTSLGLYRYISKTTPALIALTDGAGKWVLMMEPQHLPPVLQRNALQQRVTGGRVEQFRQVSAMGANISLHWKVT